MMNDRGDICRLEGLSSNWAKQNSVFAVDTLAVFTVEPLGQVRYYRAESHPCTPNKSLLGTVLHSA
jgi:hypothetical protein